MDIAELTHGHPTGYIAAGAFAVIIAELANGESMIESIHASLEMLAGSDTNGETTAALTAAVELAGSGLNAGEAVNRLGEGWTAEEALAIAVYSSLKEKNFKKALWTAVNHDGDSNPAGSICGNLMGASGGMKAVPKEWEEKVELRDLILEMAEQLHHLGGT